MPSCWCQARVCSFPLLAWTRPWQFDPSLHVPWDRHHRQPQVIRGHGESEQGPAEARGHWAQYRREGEQTLAWSWNGWLLSPEGQSLAEGEAEQLV